MIRPLPPHNGKSSNKSPNFNVACTPSREFEADANLIRSHEIHAVKTRFIAKPIIRVSACPMFNMDNGMATSNTLQRPLKRRTKTIIEAAMAESSPALVYCATRKSDAMNRCRPTRMSRETTGRCSLCCDQSHCPVNGSCPDMIGTSEKSSI